MEVAVILERHGLKDIHDKMKAANVSMNTLTWMNHELDFDTLVSQLDLTPIDSVKLRAMVRELQSTQSCHCWLNQTYDKINQISVGLETEININFHDIISKLQARQNELLLEIKRWRSQQIASSDNADAWIVKPKIEVSSRIDVNNVSTFMNIHFVDPNDSKRPLNDTGVTVTNALNPFCDEYVDIHDSADDNLESDVVPIALEYVNHRKHFVNEDIENKDQYHPKHLLDLYSNNKYYSDTIANFKVIHNKMENDWIIFKIVHEDQYFIPTLLEIKNHSNEYAVRTLVLYIGNGNGEWFAINKHDINVSNRNIFSEKI
eukprot:914479_1